MASGYFLLEHAKTRLIITSTGRTRLMERLPDAGVSPLIDRFVEGFDGIGVMTTRPAEILAFARRIPVADCSLSLRVTDRRGLCPDL